MDYLVVEISLYLALAFAIGFVADRLIVMLSPARGATGDRVAVAENLASTRETEARQLRTEIDTLRERLRITEAGTAAAQADVSRANAQVSTVRTDYTRKIMALEEEVATLKRPKPAAPPPEAPRVVEAKPAPEPMRSAAPSPEPPRAVEPEPAPQPMRSAKPSPAPTPASVAETPTPAPAVAPQEPKPERAPPPPFVQTEAIEEPLPLVAAMEIGAPTQPVAAAPAPASAASPTSTTAATSAPAPAELPPDDLKEIVGIGPILEHTLQSLGLKTFAQIATITPEDIAMLIVKVDSSIAERVLRERWVEQARELYSKKYGKEAA
ncbi:MAG: hypothetical protein GC190_08315 [Alphaproteobacteria bacterium]|nr:hypothetical protein [Alphaproteobacteria bacterium]